MLQKAVYFGFYDGLSQPVGYLKVLVPAVIADTDGGSILTYSAATDFGDGFGSTVSHMKLVFGAENAPGVKPFKRWLQPSEIVFADEEILVGNQEIEFTFMATVREFVSVTLTIEA